MNGTFQNISIRSSSTGRGTAVGRGSIEKIVLGEVIQVAIKRRFVFLLFLIKCPTGLSGTVNCPSTIIVMLTWSNHVGIVGGQSGQFFGHLDELKYDRVDVNNYYEFFLNKIFWLFYIVRTKCDTKIKFFFKRKCTHTYVKHVS